MDSQFLRKHALSIAAFSLTLTVRLVSLWRLSHSAYGDPATSDMRFYAEWAQRIADGRLTDFHAFYGQPLYAYVLGGIFALVGFQPVVIGVLQALLDAATAVLIFRIGVVSFADQPRRGAIIGAGAAIGWAFFLPSAAYSGLLIPASWTVCAWWFCVWWSMARAPAASKVQWFGVALVVGLMAMMSATVLFALPLLLTAAFMRRSAIAATLVVAGVIVGTSPAWLHNSVVARDPVFISAHSGLNFWIGNNPEANGYPRVPRALPSEQAALLRESIKIAVTAAGHPLPNSQVSAFWSAQARAYIAESPARWLKLLGVKVRNFWNRFPYDDLSSITPLRDASIVPPGLSFGLLAAFGLPGCMLSLRSPRARWITAAVLLQLLALLSVFVNERYRLAAAPGLLLLSAWWLTELWRVVGAAHWTRLALLLSLLALSTWFTTLPLHEPALRSLDNYNAAVRQLAANDYARAEMRMRKALASMVPPAQVTGGVANGFAEAAVEKMKAGHHAAALSTIDEALRLNPSDPRLQALHARIAGAQ